MSTKIIAPGTEITIFHPVFGYFYGTVRRAFNYGTDEKPDWYIEYDCTSPRQYAGYLYWKQSIDGGDLIKVEEARDE